MKMAQLNNICRRVLFNSIKVQRTRRLCNIRPISSSSGKKNEAENACEQQAIYKKVPDFSKPDKENWISYGFHYKDKELDRFRLHFMCFSLVSVLFFGIIFITYYYPDRKLSDWARREAFIRLHEREQLGLDPIDANYVDPSKIVLPSDCDLSEEDIVI